ncbi:sensor histidine kinase [Flavisolibacter nicotianae]|uniref:sensor histidine kinase n=1 Tax=Flavisolibacter nicotianae TaxID=2364882 RepID=UPI0013C4E02E|nr:histidine kinase [Flavisolibacter nicotianae]
MNAKNVLLRFKLHHVLFWLLLGAAWFYLRYQDYSTIQKALQVTIVKVLDLTIMIYIANYLLIPKLLYRKKFVLFAILVLSMIVLSSGWKMYLIGRLLHNPALYHWTDQLKARIYDNVLPHIFLVIAGMAFKLLLDYNRMQSRLLQVAKEKAETELNFLKAQINPHFLFNSLNAVYFLIDKNNNDAREALHKFSDMLRYQLYGARDNKVSIENELQYLQDYIGLQKLRNENCSIRLDVSPGLPSFTIEPLLLLPFVENSFKHLSHYADGRPNQVVVALDRQNGEMEFCVSNTTEGRSNEEPGGIGLANVRRRLELLYPKKHHLDISQEEGWFRVCLKVKIASQ